MEITQEKLQEKIDNGDKIVVDFYTDWCGPCSMMKPIFEKVSKQFRDENSKVQLYTMNVEKNGDIAVKYGIRGVPTIKSFNNGDVIDSKSGVQMESQIKELVDNLLNG
jgi:thioredoxin